MAAITILTFGYELPNNTCTGDVWFPAMERNIQRMNDHTHDGEDSSRIAATVQDVLAANWGADIGGGMYRQTVQMPVGFTFENSRIEVRRSTGEVVYPSIVKVTETTFYLYTNNNTVSYKVSYL